MRFEILSTGKVGDMLIRLLRRVRLAWIWAATMLIWRNRETIIHTLRIIWYRVRGEEQPPSVVRPGAVDTTSRERPV